MPTNIEIKAKLRSEMALVEKRCLSLSQNKQFQEHLFQKDTFFNVPNGRMKLREEGHRSILISYFREDKSGPKCSNFKLCPVEEPEKLVECLSMTLGVKGVVEKERKVVVTPYDKDATISARIHLDKVANLGEFIEFEVMIPEDSVELQTTGKAFAKDLLEYFEIQESDLMEGAYLDSLL